MYSSWFRLEKLPFRLRPDPDFLFLDGHNAHDHAQLLEALRTPGPPVTLTGVSGAGKSTWLRAALHAIASEDVAVAWLLQPHLSAAEIERALMDQFGLDPGNDLAPMKICEQFFGERRAAARQVAIVCDDAHLFSADALSSLLLLSRKPNAPRVVLSGDSTLDLHFQAGPVTGDARNRISLTVEALNERQLHDYVRQRLRLAGAPDREIFDPGTTPEIHRYTGGVPKLIHVLCDEAMVLAENRTSDRVTAQDIRDAVCELKWSTYSTKSLETATDSGVERISGTIDSGAPSADTIISEPCARSGEMSGSASAEKSVAPDASPTLTVRWRGLELRRVVLKEGRLIIGRTPGCGLQLDDPSVSRAHCQVIMGSTGCFIEDLGSTNGVIVNLRRVRLHRLRHDDVIKLGDHTLNFCLGDLPPGESL